MADAVFLLRGSLLHLNNPCDELFTTFQVPLDKDSND
jgi:hypothetical protein